MCCTISPLPPCPHAYGVRWTIHYLKWIILFATDEIYLPFQCYGSPVDPRNDTIDLWFRQYHDRRVDSPSVVFSWRGGQSPWIHFKIKLNHIVHRARNRMEWTQEKKVEPGVKMMTWRVIGRVCNHRASTFHLFLVFHMRVLIKFIADECIAPIWPTLRQLLWFVGCCFISFLRTTWTTLLNDLWHHVIVEKFDIRIEFMLGCVLPVLLFPQN